MRWWDDPVQDRHRTKEEDQTLLMMLGVSARFTAREDGTVELPFDTRYGSASSLDLWQRWLDLGPVAWCRARGRAAGRCAASGSTGGTRDEWYLDVGAEAFQKALLAAGVAEDLIHFELFEAGHMGIDYRYPLSLAWLCGRMAKKLAK